MNKPTRILDKTDAPFYKWFTDGTLNTCYNALDRHVEQGHASQAAIHYWSAMTNSGETITYGDLTKRVSKVYIAVVMVYVY